MGASDVGLWGLGRAAIVEAIALAGVYLFLQGPHGPFFRGLARALRREGATVLKVGFNRADDREWGDVGPYQPYSAPTGAYAKWLNTLMEERGVTDIALYGDTRPAHAEAIALARARGVRVHVFEEGYLRPFWVTYERGGANGHSRLMDIGVAEMAEAATIEDYEPHAPPPHWGAAWRHAFHGFRYHFDVVFRNRAYPNHKPHRQTNAWLELGYYLKRLLLLPLLMPETRIRQASLLRGGRTFHLVLLQLAIDASMRDHSRYRSVTAFMDDVLEAFAAHAPDDQLLVFKSHPFEDGRERLERQMRRKAAALGIAGRTRFLHGGKLGPLLDRARSAVTVNSTAGQQALWRGLPLAVMGAAVYDKPEFVKHVDLDAFFRSPSPPDAEAYRGYRQYLMMSSQVRGSYYTRAGRAAAIAAIAPKMLDPLDPYDRAMQIGREATAALAEAPNVALFPGGGVRQT